MFLEVLQQRAAVTMNDAFGNTGRPGGKQDKQRMIKGHLSECDVGCRVGLDKVGETDSADNVGDIRYVLHIRHDYGTQEARQSSRYFGIFRQAIDAFAVVPIAVYAQQQLGLDLPETVEYSLHTEVW
ncbi:hypothetical protein D3C84_535630 [compost metagenome]